MSYTPEACEERRRRIRLSVAAYAYEYENSSIMSDDEFDRLCKQVNLEQPTGDDELDEFFKKTFHPDTGMWVRSHPDKQKLSAIYRRHHNQ